MVQAAANMSAAPAARSLPREAAAALVGGVLAAISDIFGASLIYKTPVLVIMRVVASGLLGKAVIKDGDLGVSAIGMGLHTLIAIVCAAIYIVASRRLPVLLRRPVTLGLLFGFAVFCVMNLVVVPLSAAGAHFDPVKTFNFAANPPKGLDLLSNMIFGAIIAVTASLMLRRRG
jgi:hypothetical protein